MNKAKKTAAKAVIRAAATITAGIIAGECLWFYTEKKIDEHFEEVQTELKSKSQSFNVAEKLSAAAEEQEEPAEDVAGLTFTDEESQMLLKLAMAEAGDQGVIGKAIVMNVVHNRMLSEDFPDTIEEVIFEPKQFSPISDGRYAAAVPDEECYEALEMVINYWDGSAGALFFEADWNANSWHKENLTELFQYGNLIFYK